MENKYTSVKKIAKELALEDYKPIMILKLSQQSTISIGNLKEFTERITRIANNICFVFIRNYFYVTLKLQKKDKFIFCYKLAIYILRFDDIESKPPNIFTILCFLFDFRIEHAIILLYPPLQ